MNCANNPDIPKWEVIGGKQTVIICAEKRPAYEHKRDWEKAFRREVQDVMRLLTAKEGEMLTAKYGSAGGDMVDTENAVFYNFNPPVSQAVRHGVAFKTLSPDEMYTVFDVLGKKDYKHLYIYSIEPITPAPVEDSIIQPFARWRDIPVKTMRIQNAEYYFMAMRENPECFLICCTGQINGDFGLNIRIRSPEKEPYNLMPLMKPLLDGIISSFHRLPENTAIDGIIENADTLLHSVEDWRCWFRDERNVAATAIARELACFMWGLMTDNVA